MGWQEEEKLKRAEEQKIKDAATKRAELSKAKMKELWDNLLLANERLDKELRLGVFKGQGSCEGVINGKKARLYYRGSGISNDRDSEVNDDPDYVFFYYDANLSCLVASKLNRYRYKIKDDSCYDKIIRNLCIGANITHQLERIDDKLQQNLSVNITTKKQSGCFVATAVYGSYDADEVVILRTFRDKHLQTNCLGRLIVDLYYSYSPFLAKQIENREELRIALKRAVFNPLCSLLKKI